jgi:predicted ArsR family transcriptional regulator
MVKTMPADRILQQLKLKGQMLDTEIAVATGASLQQVRSHMADAVASGQVLSCTITRYDDGKPVEAQQYRLSGYVPPAAPGRKPGSAPK